MNDERLDVLVVGAGPTGLTMACELLRQGATVRVIDELDAPVTYSKAAVVHARTMEHFDALGVASAVLDRSRIVHGTNIFASGKRVAHVGLDQGIDSPFPHAYGISQHDTEEILAAELTRLGGRVERGVSFASFTEDTAFVHAVVKKDGAHEEIRARWLVGCDGAHSAVRKALDLSFEGAPYEERIIQADLEVSFAGVSTDDEILIFLHELGPAMAFPLFRDGRYRLILLDASDGHAPLSEAAPEPKLEDFRRGLADRGIEAKLGEPAWMIGFRIHHRHAEELRRGRAFIAGDAAHIHSPVGGQGMNTGIQDAVNLAWKLALVARGRGRPELLDSYQAERMPVIKSLVSSTDRATRVMTSAVRLRSPLAVRLRDQLLSTITRLGVVQAQASSAITMLSVGYHDSPICTQERSSLWRTTVVSSETSEAPGVLDWAAFGGGPAPGARAVDATARRGKGDGPVRVHELLRQGRHVALLFDGAAATEAGYANLIGIAKHLRARASGVIDPFLVLPMAEALPAARWEGSTLFDEDGEVHRRYGARSECLYVLRPDGYVGFRSQPADGPKLDAWLDLWLAA